ncbi:MAG: hybrid sensor histidine kinase/response regulator [Rubrivivax sp.]|nr:MAG: hybrid sensor histidine kinase/response regulator [Rubrivivax sp.]
MTPHGARRFEHDGDGPLLSSQVRHSRKARVSTRGDDVEGIPSTFEDDLDESVRDRLPEMELAAVMGIGRSFPLPYLAVPLGCMVFLYGRFPTASLIGWVVTYLVYIAARTFSTWAYHRDARRHTPTHVRLWRLSVSVSAACHGLILGSLAFVALPYLSAALQVAVIGWIIAICAVGTMYAAAMLAPVNILMICALLPYAVSWHLQVESPIPMPAMLLGFLAVFCYLNVRQHRVLRDNFALLAKSEKLLGELGRKNRQLEAAHRSRVRLVATASHDLRQPVHTLGLLIARLDATQSVDRLNASFARLEHACSLVSEMLAELMDLSQLESREYRTRLSVVELDGLLEQVRLNYTHMARAKGVGLNIDFCGERVSTDARLLRRILFNLTANAVRYTNAGSVTMTCRREGADIVITVTDTGPGIAAEHLPHIFEDYVRAGEDAGDGEALGLGLAIVRRACKVLGHTVTVSSTVGRGTVFQLRLPVAERDDGTVSTATAGSRRPPRHTILVIENDTEALHAMCELVASWGYECIALPSGDELDVTLDASVTPSAIISDLHLSDGPDGFGIIALARAHLGRPDLPALLVTGDVSPSLARRASEADVTLAHKPLAPQQLRRELDALLVRGATPN